MKTLLIALCLAGAASGAFAQKKPAYDEARAIYDELGKPVAQTSIWFRKPLQERIQAARSADELVKRAERLWGTAAIGPGSACRKAAIGMKFYVLNLNDLALLAEGRRTLSSPSDLLAPSFHAVQFGQDKAACYDEVEALDTGAKKG